MFKTAWNGFKTLGKKAIGFVRGLNGDKAATFLTDRLMSWNPAIGIAASPILAEIGKRVNDKLEEWAENQAKAAGGGVHKPIKALVKNINWTPMIKMAANALPAITLK